MAHNNFHALPLVNLNEDSKKRKHEKNLRTWKWNEVIDVDAIPDKVEIKTEETTPQVVSSDEDSTDHEENLHEASIQKIVSSDLSISSPYGNDINKHIGISSSSGSVENMVYSYLSISSPDSYWDTTDYSIHDETLGSTISEYEEKLMDELDWGQDISILKHVATHKCTNEVPHALDTSTNDFSVNDPNKGKSIVDEEPIVVETYLNNFTHDESLSLHELASDVNKDVSSFKSYNRTG
nr:replication protein A 70 kDa DNA-binding subunit B [Tanacetum cinerariifolium]